jgi:predicted porin
MKKKLRITMIACVIALPAIAFADIDLYQQKFIVYGQANVSFDSVNTGDPETGEKGTAVNKVQSNSSRLGFKGSEPVGADTSVIWQVEQAVNFDTGPAGEDSFTTRDSFAGLKNERIGSAMIGFLSTPYKVSTRDLDLFGDAVADNRSLMGRSEFGSFDGEVNSAIAYATPRFGGLSGVIGWNNLSPDNVVDSDYNAEGVSAAIMYDRDALYATAAYSHNRIAAGVDESAAKLGIAFRPEAFFIAVVIEKIKEDNLGVSGDRDAFYVTGRYNVGNGALKAAFTRVGDRGSVNDSGAKQYSLGYDHYLSQVAAVYVLYTRLENDDAAGYSLASGSSLPNVANGLGGSPSAASVGMRYAF